MGDWVCSNQPLEDEGNEKFKIHRVECSPSTTYGKYMGRYVKTSYQVRDADTDKLLDSFTELEDARADTGKRLKEYEQVINKEDANKNDIHTDTGSV